MITKRRAVSIVNPLYLTWALLICSIITVRGQNPTSTDFNLNQDGVIIEGYDLVSYFIGTVVKGKSTFKHNHLGVEYWFVNEENRTFFIKDPDQFIPAYGGWCAYAMAADGEKVTIDPETYKIIEGKLYLFYNSYFNNTLIKWNKDEQNLRKKADDNWLKLISR